jgi:hypothetical protein
MKKTYEKPKVTKVELRPEEAALTACKVTGLVTCTCHPAQATVGAGCMTAAS